MSALVIVLIMYLLYPPAGVCYGLFLIWRAYRRN